MYIIAAWTVREEKESHTRRGRQERNPGNWEMGKELEMWEGLDNGIINFCTV